MLEWLPHERAWRWFFGAIALGLLLASADAVGRSISAIRRYGFNLWFRSLFQVEIESLRTLGVLLLLVAALLFVAIRGAG
jgi:hypothetical protein